MDLATRQPLDDRPERLHQLVGEHDVLENRVAAPALVVMGSKDPDFEDPAEEARWIAEKVHGTALVVDGAGHYPHVETQKRLGRRLCAFSRQLRGAVPPSGLTTESVVDAAVRLADAEGPPVSRDELIGMLERAGAPKFAKRLRGE